MKEYFPIATGNGTFYASSVSLLSPLKNLNNLRKSKIKYDYEKDIMHHIIPSGSNKISRTQGSPIKCLFLGTLADTNSKFYLIMDMDTAYIAFTDKYDEVTDVRQYRGYNPFKDIGKGGNYLIINKMLLAGVNELYDMPLSKAMYEFVIHGGSYAVIEDNKTSTHFITPVICKLKNIENNSVYNYKILDKTFTYTPPFLEYVNGQFARIIQIIDNVKVSLEEHDLKSDSELRWVTAFHWQNPYICLDNLMKYGIIIDYESSNCVTNGATVITVTTKNRKKKTFICDYLTGNMSLVL